MKKMIFSIEDDEDISLIIDKSLKNANYDVEIFGQFKSFKARLEEIKPDLILLDLMLPEKSGKEILKYLKESLEYNLIPVIIISAKNQEIDKVNLLDLGADDYITKPFGILELISRVNVHLRKSMRENKMTLECRCVTIHLNDFTCKKNDENIRLTKKEFELLTYLFRKKNQVVTKEELMNKVWGYDFLGESRTIDIHINRLREKLGNDFIETIYGIGYKVEE